MAVKQASHDMFECCRRTLSSNQRRALDGVQIRLPAPRSVHLPFCLTPQTTAPTTTMTSRTGSQNPPYPPPIQPMPHEPPSIMFPLCARTAPVPRTATVPHQVNQCLHEFPDRGCCKRRSTPSAGRAETHCTSPPSATAATCRAATGSGAPHRQPNLRRARRHASVRQRTQHFKPDTRRAEPRRRGVARHPSEEPRGITPAGPRRCSTWSASAITRSTPRAPCCPTSTAPRSRGSA